MDYAELDRPPSPPEKNLIPDFLSARTADIGSALANIESICDSLFTDTSSLADSYGLSHHDESNILFKLGKVKSTIVIAQVHLSNLSYFLPKQ
jgi:hypothetical protein